MNLAELSMSGSLRPAVPIQLLLKFDPPKITMIYHFENNRDEKYYHDVLVDKHMLADQTEEEICNHLFMIEAYYFNPKQLKR